MIVAAPLKQSACYLSTPDHTRSFIGRFIYIYTGKGQLTLNETCLEYVGLTGASLTIPLDTILDVRIGSYSLWAKPIRLDYIAVTYTHEGEERTTLFTPMLSSFAPTWETNKVVADWAESLQNALAQPV